MFPQYEKLARWADEHNVEFEVRWYPDFHTLSVTHHLDDGMCRYGLFKFPHKGGCHETTVALWHDKTILDFVNEFKEMAMPIQPTAPLGYVL